MKSVLSLYIPLSSLFPSPSPPSFTWLLNFILLFGFWIVFGWVTLFCSQLLVCAYDLLSFTVIIIIYLIIGIIISIHTTYLLSCVLHLIRLYVTCLVS
jgi:hypothetical protein